MNTSLNRARLATVGGLLLAGTITFADSIRFSDFTPLPISATPVLDETAPITFGNPLFQQESIADRQFQVDADKPNNGTVFGTDDDAAAWDMITLNETGRHRGRFLFTVFEQGIVGVQRHDLRTGETDTIWNSPSASDHSSFDACFWTPWGTLITGEEDWLGPTTFGRLFEFKNPTKAPGIYNPVGPTSNDGADFVHQNVIPRTAHEGIQFDSYGNMYFIDELAGGNIYKYTPKAKFWKVMAGKADYFAAGQTFVLRVGDGNTPNAVGAYTWVPFTDANGAGLPGAVTFVDGPITSVDASLTTNVAAFKGTDYQRPEDMQIQRVRGREYLYVTTTGTSEVYRLDLKSKTISVFANQSSIDLATDLGVGTAFRSPDNLAVDHEGNIYIVEDRSGGVDDDIWFAKDLNKDGDLLDAGEGIGRWASNGTAGSEFTGLYFDPFHRNRAWVNIQHPNSSVDRTMEITIPGDHEHHGHHGHDHHHDEHD
jgi:hypothetical protein